MAWNTEFDDFITASARLSIIWYAAPAVVLVLVFEYFDLTRPYVIHALIVYLIGAVAHMITYGFQAVCVQIKVCTDYALEKHIEKTG